MRRFLPPRAAAELPVSSNGQSANLSSPAAVQRFAGSLQPDVIKDDRAHLAKAGKARTTKIECHREQRQRQLVVAVQAGPATAHADDKGGPADIAGTRPDKLALRGIEVPEQTNKMVKIINRSRGRGWARRIARLAIGKARFLEKIRPGAAAASWRGLRRAGQLSRDGTRLGSGCHS